MCLGYAPVVVATTPSFGRLSASAAVAVIPSSDVAALSCLFGAVQQYSGTELYADTSSFWNPL